MSDTPGNGGTVLYRLDQIERLFGELDRNVERSRELISRHEEQINGDRGLSKGLAALADEIKSLKRAIWIVGAGIVTSAVGFCFTVLTVFGQ